MVLLLPFSLPEAKNSGSAAGWTPCGDARFMLFYFWERGSSDDSKGVPYLLFCAVTRKLGEGAGGGEGIPSSSEAE